MTDAEVAEVLRTEYGLTRKADALVREHGRRWCLAFIRLLRAKAAMYEKDADDMVLLARTLSKMPERIDWTELEDYEEGLRESEREAHYHYDAMVERAHLRNPDPTPHHDDDEVVVDVDALKDAFGDAITLGSDLEKRGRSQRHSEAERAALDPDGDGDDYPPIISRYAQRRKQR